MSHMFLNLRKVDVTSLKTCDFTLMKHKEIIKLNKSVRCIDMNKSNVSLQISPVYRYKSVQCIDIN